MEDGSAVISTGAVQAAAVISTGVAVRRRSGEISFATASETRRARFLDCARNDRRGTRCARNDILHRVHVFQAAGILAVDDAEGCNGLAVARLKRVDDGQIEPAGKRGREKARVEDGRAGSPKLTLEMPSTVRTPRRSLQSRTASRISGISG